MRTIDSARQWWPLLDEVNTLEDLKDAVKHSTGRREAFLLFENVDRSTWPTLLNDSRDAYNSLRAHFLRAIEHPDELESAGDPLSETDELSDRSLSLVKSPWVVLRKDEELRAEIFQDVERCMPDNTYFRQPTTQNMLLDILFIFCKLNPDVGYRQGMHEVLAPVLWVVERDAVSSTDKSQTEGNKDELLLRAMFDGSYIEHDTFTLFGLIMQNAKAFYEPGSTARTAKIAPSTESPMLMRCRRIFDQLLPAVDPGLADHLKEVDVVPQIFLMRWIRLLFGREFPYDDVLAVWDLLFAEDPTLDLVDLICVAMLLRVRWQLIEADNSTALGLLLRYPVPQSPQSPQTFVEDAVYLRQNLDAKGGSHLVAKYTQRPLPLVNLLDQRPTTPERRNSRSPSIRPLSPFGSPVRIVPQPTNFETLLSNAARNMYKRGEELGLNKAVRDAVGEVRKNVQGLQNARNSPRPKQTAAPASLNSPEGADALSRVTALEERNKSLARMLQVAVAELWECQKETAELKEFPKEAVEKLSMAIAKVQFAQVYLEDLTMPLPSDEPSTEQDATPTDPASNQQHPYKKPNEPEVPSDKRRGNSTEDPRDRFNELPTIKLTEPSSHSSTQASIQASTPPQKPSNREGKSNVRVPDRPTRTAPRSPPPNFNQSRPSLAHSSFSWMLGQDERPTAAPAAVSSSAARQRRAGAGKGFLFGDPEGEAGTADAKRKGSVERREEIFDMDKLRRDRGHG
ncbi:hypothetical protein H2199_007554 [Coniosporium tulheliwenetii]|uniref:Uncharacterized protein n=1 Tax=Coniosporium tulheliwenetii TaxID=3383036 RepID=A0ACC2YQA0_9PEZI|nr:hypothetical protein H2199_007554 [Cladosporium sp. JES 115]